MIPESVFFKCGLLNFLFKFYVLFSCGHAATGCKRSFAGPMSQLDIYCWPRGPVREWRLLLHNAAKEILVVRYRTKYTGFPSIRPLDLGKRNILRRVYCKLLYLRRYGMDLPVSIHITNTFCSSWKVDMKNSLLY